MQHLYRRAETMFVEDLALFEQFFNSIKEGRKFSA
jgi:hypothetical protein